MEKSSPKILLLNQQKKWKTRLPDLKRDIELALSEVIRMHTFPATIQEIEFLLVTPSQSASVHQQFFDDPSATDVMTFSVSPLASIMICPEIARQQRHEEGLSIYAEVLTYAIHGLLHLCGMNDLTQHEFEVMRREQSKIRQRVLVAN